MESIQNKTDAMELLRYAIELEYTGDIKKAIEFYQKAINEFIKEMEKQPTEALYGLYFNFVLKYIDRIQDLKNKFPEIVKEPTLEEDSSKALNCTMDQKEIKDNDEPSGETQKDTVTDNSNGDYAGLTDSTIDEDYTGGDGITSVEHRS
ncbi:uncharacterized protein LOC119689951 [Teleopsis dalmanni]|uniref:uncharacterized protein LOC119662039 n=1 Tax=Teleopsis dalmanni TaxID=139649 RepID=UPI0018CF90AA|nr:uncharacterized protein LOC119662039 [Teleopsis dalmanni]XP_037927543.1 uncharacterized protein LOC119662071 [Teleopsis dalmanni]XP_037927575.1 uncharacterized protein LOC119662098 [Teleopsis dalmanni]XP_037960830.1 uncharacterized protein LOC119689951 [Teleopsis dalmanni]